MSTLPSAITIVANRLPISYREPEGWSASPGGLSKVVNGVIDDQLTTWVGWAGRSKPEVLTGKKDIQNQTLPLESNQEIFLSTRETVQYYEGWSNSGLWPMYHNFRVDSCFDEDDYQVYSEVNLRFARRVADVAPHGSCVWVHDYHLQLVPLMLRGLRADLRIGFFLHIPFPASAEFTSIPYAKEMLEGILGADLIGFQAPQYFDNFLLATQKLTGYSIEGCCIKVGEQGCLRVVQVDVFPVGIDAKGIDASVYRPDIRVRADEIRRQLGNPEVLLLGIDRLDYTKGIDVRMNAVAELIASGHLDLCKTVFLQISMTTRENIDVYQLLAEQTRILADSLNAQIGVADRQCIRYTCELLNYDNLLAHYLAADVMLVTPYCDGMNIVCKEYVATRYDCSGALVLSSFAGAAHQLQSAWHVNPYDLESVKAGIIDAVRSSDVERSERMSLLRRAVFEHDAKLWADTFLHRLAASPG